MRSSGVIFLIGCVFMAFLSSINGVKGQELSNSGSVPFSVSYDHLALQVRDLDASAQFYGEVLGLTEVEAPARRRLMRWYSLGNGDQLHLIAYSPGKVKLTKVTHFALSVSDFDAALEHLKSKGVTFSNFAGKAWAMNCRGDGVRQVYFQDPDGYWVEFNDAEQ